VLLFLKKENAVGVEKGILEKKSPQGKGWVRRVPVRKGRAQKKAKKV